MSDSKVNRAEGMILAAAAGDALGWPQELRGGLIGGKKARRERIPFPEFTNWSRRGGNRFSGYFSDLVEAGDYSDDTQLICALARSYLSGEDWFSWFIRVELPTWPLYQRGGGAAVIAAARSWAERRAPWEAEGSKRASAAAERYMEAGGNGAAMRVAPHVLVSGSLPDLMHRVLVDAATTHGHPRAQIGALVYAAALRFAFESPETLEYGSLVQASMDGLLDGAEASDVLGSLGIEQASSAQFVRQWDQTVSETAGMLEFIALSLHRNAMADDQHVLDILGVAGPKGGAGNKTAVAAIYLASRGAARPLSGLLSAAFLDESDTDTIASMVGGVLGAIHGDSWLKELSKVQDADYLKQLGRALMERDPEFSLATETSAPTDSQRLREDILDLPRGKTLQFPDGRSFEIDGRRTLDPGNVVRNRLRVADGQTIYVDRHLTSSEIESRLAKRTASRNNTQITAVKVVLETNSLFETAHFYSQLLQRELTPENGQLEISTQVAFKEVIDSPMAGLQEIELLIEDAHLRLETIKRRFGGQLQGSSLAVTDPDGRIVRIALA